MCNTQGSAILTGKRELEKGFPGKGYLEVEGSPLPQGTPKSLWGVEDLSGWRWAVGTGRDGSGWSEVARVIHYIAAGRVPG